MGSDLGGSTNVLLMVEVVFVGFRERGRRFLLRERETPWHFLAARHRLARLLISITDCGFLEQPTVYGAHHATFGFQGLRFIANQDLSSLEGSVFGSYERNPPCPTVIVFHICPEIALDADAIA